MNAPAANPIQQAANPGRFVPVTESGGFVDTGSLYLGADGKTVELLEYSHELAPNNATFKQAQELAAALGPDWQVASPQELLALVNYDKYDPATDAPGMESRWYHTRQVDASSPSDLAIVVYLLHGYVHWDSQGSTGRVRAVRRVRASQYLTLGL